MTVHQTPALPALSELHPVDTPAAALHLGEVFAAQPVPTLFELHRVVDVVGISGTGRIAVGVTWPLAGGALMRWSTQRPPINYPQRVRQIEIVDTIAEIMGVHGHQGATRIRLIDPADPPPAGDHDAPEAFAVVDPAGDVEAWGVWWPRDERVAVQWPEHTVFDGRRQVPRITQYRSLSSLVNDLPVPARDGVHRLVYLNSGGGRRLIGRVRAAHADQLDRAQVAYDLATRATPLAALPDELRSH